MAALVFRAMIEDAGLTDHIRTDSAGTAGMFAGCTADVRAIAVLEEAGYPTEHKARLFRSRWLQSRDLLVALDIGHQRILQRWVREYGGPEVALLRSFDPELPPGAPLGVPDPYSGGLDAFRACLAMVEPACAGLLENVRGRVARSQREAA